MTLIYKPYSKMDELVKRLKNTNISWEKQALAVQENSQANHQCFGGISLTLSSVKNFQNHFYSSLQYQYMLTTALIIVISGFGHHICCQKLCKWKLLWIDNHWLEWFYNLLILISLVVFLEYKKMDI